MKNKILPVFLSVATVCTLSLSNDKVGDNGITYEKLFSKIEKIINHKYDNNPSFRGMLNSKSNIYYNFNKFYNQIDFGEFPNPNSCSIDKNMNIESNYYDSPAKKLGDHYCKNLFSKAFSGKDFKLDNSINFFPIFAKPGKLTKINTYENSFNNLINNPSFKKKVNENRNYRFLRDNSFVHKIPGYICVYSKEGIYSYKIGKSELDVKNGDIVKDFLPPSPSGYSCILEYYYDLNKYNKKK